MTSYTRAIGERKVNIGALKNGAHPTGWTGHKSFPYLPGTYSPFLGGNNP